jgi:predicted DNA-binding protein YlxM (UPF0122 family)
MIRKGKRLGIKTRREIFRLYNQEKISVESIADTYKVPPGTIYNILQQRVKLDKSPRADKGSKKGIQLPKLPTTDKLIRDGEPIETLLEIQAANTLIAIEKAKLTIVEKAKILETVARIQKQIHEQKIENHLKRPDAQVIARIVRRFMPEASEADVIKIFREELEKWKSEK